MDTIMIIRDSVATCVNKMAAICQPCVKETGTSWQDVAIVFLICLTLVIIALYAISKYYKCKKDEREASASSTKEKRDNDVKDREWKLDVDKKAHELKRKEEKEDHELKRKEEQEALDKKRRTDLQDKLLCQLKDISEIERDKDGKEIKKYNDNSKEYTTVLQAMISKLDSPTNTPNEKEA